MTVYSWSPAGGATAFPVREGRFAANWQNHGSGRGARGMESPNRGSAAGRNHHRDLELEGGCYAGARMARRCFEGCSSRWRAMIMGIEKQKELDSFFKFKLMAA